MKNLLLIPFMVLTLTGIKATDLPTISLVKDKTFVLNINDWNKNELNISFLTQEGEEIYSERIQPTNSHQQKYNLQILSKGSYQMLVSNGIKHITYKIDISENSITKISKGVDAYIPQTINKDILSKILSFN